MPYGAPGYRPMVAACEKALGRDGYHSNWHEVSVSHTVHEVAMPRGERRQASWALSGHVESSCH